jgi:5-methyltetrahydrofolate--homocysteine methyltransferase
MPRPDGIRAQGGANMTVPLIDLARAVEGGDRERVVALTDAAIAAGSPAATLLNDALLPAMKIVGNRFRDYEIFLPDVLMAARAMSGAMERLRPLLISEGVPLVGKVVVGTVRGDLHDIGKNLVGIMLQGAGFEVIDLGVDVEPSAFVDAAVEGAATVIGMSALLTTTMTGMGEVIAALERQGLRGSVKTIVGGAPLSAAFAREIGADAFAADAPAAVERVRVLAGVTS